MRKATFSVSVKAPAATVWNLLLDKMEHPERYVPGVEECRILESYEDGVLRRMKVGGMEITERATVTPEQQGGEIVYALVDHPLYSGRIVNRVVASSVQSPVAPVTLTFELDWAPVSEDAERIAYQNMAAGLQDAVEAIRDAAEEADPKGRAPDYTLNARD